MNEHLLDLSQIMRDLRAKYRGAHKRYSERVWRGDDSECWPWLGHVNGPSTRADGSARAGYGIIWIDGRWVRAHRFALFGAAALTRKDHALHHCDNTLCCNPAHLYAGTQAENTRDAEQRGRLARIRGRFAKVTTPHIGDLIHSDIDLRAVVLDESTPLSAGAFRVANVTQSRTPAPIDIGDSA